MVVAERDREVDTEMVKVVLRHRMKPMLDAYYSGWKNADVAERSREATLDEVAADMLSMLRLHRKHEQAPAPDETVREGN